MAQEHGLTVALDGQVRAIIDEPVHADAGWTTGGRLVKDGNVIYETRQGTVDGKQLVKWDLELQALGRSLEVLWPGEDD
jgi:hypothetical protein